MIASRVFRKAQSFAHLSRFEKAWLVPAWFLLGACRLLILFVPFRRLAPRLGAHAGVSPWVPLLDPGSEARALSIARVVQTAARNTPWESSCFPQAVAARVLLGVYGVPYALFFGVARDAEHATLKAHAWVAAGRVRVTGGASFGDFAVVGCYVARGLAGVGVVDQA